MTKSATSIRLARPHKLLEAIGPPKTIDRLQEPQYRRGPQDEDSMDKQVVMGHETRKQAILGRHPQPLAQGLHKRYPARLVTFMRGPLIGRGLGLAKIMHEGCKPSARGQAQRLGGAQGQ